VYEKFLGNTCSLLVAHDGVSEDFFTDLPTDAKRKAREKFNIPLDKKVVAYIGGFDAWKGVETFFEAASFNTDVLFVAIGGSTEQINKIQDIYPRVKFLGFSPYTELAFNQQIADILVIPNTAKNILSSSYTSPLKLFAYMTSEVPILCSDIDSLRSVVSEESAYFFEADNAQALAGKVDEILNDQAGSSKKADQALTLAKNYTWKKRAALIENFIGK
jgi:glycosyltransferase involved in cell wall biosynthesis